MPNFRIVYGVDILGTCDMANPNFFDQFRKAFQTKFAQQFKISTERVFL